MDRCVGAVFSRVPYQSGNPALLVAVIRTSFDETAQITKTCERMYALLAICTTLSPGPSDESIMSIVKEHYGDQLSLMQRGG
jgi:hypothetical protein